MKKAKNIDLKQYGMFLALIAIFILFFVLSQGANATPVNINNLVMQKQTQLLMLRALILHTNWLR